MAKWILTINIAKYIGDDDSYEGIKKASNSIINAITKQEKTLIRRNVIEVSYDLEDLLSNMYGARELAIDKDPNALSEFNYALNDLYDWADSERIWFGTR